MGIKIKNLDHLPLTLGVQGIATAASNKDIVQVPFDGFLAAVNAVCASGGTGATDSIIDIHVLGVTIFSTAPKITFTSTSGAVTYGALTTDPLPVTAGTTISLDVDSISTNFSGVKVTVTISRRPPANTLLGKELDTLM
jgi:hypothetical protein